MYMVKKILNLRINLVMSKQAKTTVTLEPKGKQVDFECERAHNQVDSILSGESKNLSTLHWQLDRNLVTPMLSYINRKPICKERL